MRRGAVIIRQPVKFGGLLLILLLIGIFKSASVKAQSFPDGLLPSFPIVISQNPIEDLDSTVTNFQPLPYAQTVESTVDCSVQACVALTFDDGPNPLTTPRALAALEQAGVPATFFVVGNRVATNVDLLKRMQLDGDEVGNHSWSHPDFTKLSVSQIREQIDKTQTAVSDVGLTSPRFFRPPYEARNSRIEQIVQLPFILWNVDPKDWHQKRPDDLVQAVVSQAKPGAIIILHDTKEITVQALPKIISQLKPNYQLVTVSQLLNLQPNAQGEFFGR